MSIFLKIFKAGWKSRGFTILELLAVFALLAIVAAVVAPRYTGVVHAGKVKACNSNVEIITQAAKMYYEVNGEWPKTKKQLFEEDYISEDVHCPVAAGKGADTDYEIVGTGEKVTVTCRNEDHHKMQKPGEENTEE